MQPDGQQPYENPPTEPTQPTGPVVTLSPEDPQQAQAAAEQSQPEASASEQEGAQPVRWQATEYIHREKDHVWFLLFMVVTIVLIAVAVFLIRSWTFAILVPVMAVALLVYIRRPPRVLDYTLGRHGLYINDQLFAFGEFKSFALMQGLDHHTIMLIPTKRFKPAVTINFPEEAGEAIVDMLAARLPMREVQPDVVDRIIKKLHL